MSLKIISGGQTGVDRAALDIAMRLAIPAGGFCPKGRLAEDGPLHPKYPLQETTTNKYPQRTFLNVETSDGTLVLCAGKLTGGTSLTINFAKSLHKPFLIVDLSKTANVQTPLQWIKDNNIQALNIAGPRESTRPGIYAMASVYLEQLFISLK